MASARRGSGRSSVGRHLSRLAAVNLVVLLVIGIAGIVGTVRAHDSVHFLTRTVEPAARDNAHALQDLTDAEISVWGYSISGEADLAIRYREARRHFEIHRDRLQRLGPVDGELALLVDDFVLATDNWITAYADPRVDGPVGLGTFDRDRFDRARALFADVVETNAAVGQRLREMSSRADASTERLKRWLVVALVALLLAGATLVWLVGRRIGRKVTEPLDALEQPALRLAAGEHEARASTDGPREVAQVAAAMNRVAEENDRARAVESRVVEQLRALDTVRSDFVSNVSHELRTPLTSILGYLELLEDELGDEAESEAGMVAAAKRNVVRLGELIDDLLALTRSEAQRTDLAPVDLVVLARDVVTDLRVASSQQRVAIRLDVPESPVPIRADASQVARVLTNLVGNAVKFSRGASEVAVTVAAEHAEAVVTVEDHGIGIPTDEMDHLGSRFYRASNAVELGVSGTGLGLRIVQAIVENHRGSVELQSEEGVGTVARVRLPLASTLEVPDAVEEAAEDSEPPAGVSG